MTDPRPLLARLDELDRTIETDRRVFEFRLRRGLFSTRGEGVFLYRRPDRVRIDLYAATSELVFQYRRRGARSTLYLPTEGRVLEGRSGGITLAGIEGLEGVRVREAELLALMLGRYPRSPIAGGRAPEMHRGKDGLLLRLEDRGESVFLEHDPRTLALERVTVAGAGRGDRTITFADPRPVAGRSRPWTMTFVDGGHDLELRVTVREERIDGGIPEALFEVPAAPANGPRADPERFDNPGD